jgi:hypothetical protein
MVSASPVTGEEDDNVTITLEGGEVTFGFYPQHTPILLAAAVSGPQTISNDGNLIYGDNEGDVFPLRNGPVMIVGSDEILIYRYNDRSANTLVGLRNPLNSAWTLTVDANDTIVLLPAVRLHSTGRAGADDLRVEREVIYDTPLSTTDDVTQRRRFTERFDDRDNWSSKLAITRDDRD